VPAARSPAGGRAPGGADVDWAALRGAAVAAMTRAYAPYSGFPVGAAGLADDGRIVVGCNVENACYGVGLCAECGMVSALVASGGGRLVAVSCVDGTGDPLMPCGRCRQLLWEHGGAACLVDAPGRPRPMAELLPEAFDAADLDRVEDGPPHEGARQAAKAAVPAALATHVGRGTVFVHADVLSGQQLWTGYWERSAGTGDEPAGIIEEAPTWPDVAAAVGWGRARTPRVIVVTPDGATAWAGAGDPPAEVGRRWEP
jgi:cytidine deaminase